MPTTTTKDMQITSAIAWTKDFSVDSEDEIRAFATAIGDMNPVHHDNEAARASGLQGIIAPGVMVGGFVSAAIAEKLPGAMVCQLEMKFRNPLYAGSFPAVLCTVVFERRKIMKINVVVKNGAETLADGACIVVLPR